MTRTAAFLTAIGLTMLPAGGASAQPIGTFTWQMQPFCNRVTLALTSAATGFTADGFDDQCGAPVRSGVVGVGVFNPNGSVGITLTIVTAANASPLHVTALVSPTTGQGTWADSVGSSGNFVLAGTASGLPVRPATRALPVVDVAENPRLSTDPCDPGGPATLVLCGTAADQWRSGTPEMPGLQIWRDAEGLVHMRGSVAYTAFVDTREKPIVVLPPGLRPKRTLGFPIAVGTLVAPHQFEIALLVIDGEASPTPGVLKIRGGPNSAGRGVYVGEVAFRVDR